MMLAGETLPPCLPMRGTPPGHGAMTGPRDDRCDVTMSQYS